MGGGSKHTNKQWYYASRNERIGPVPANELKNLYDAGTILPDDLIWTPGLDDWQPAGELVERFSAAAPQMAHRPPPAASYGGAASVAGGVGAGAFMETPVTKSRFGGVDAVRTEYEMSYANFLLRFVAAIVDGLILMVIQVPIILGMGFMLAGMVASSQNPEVTANILSLVLQLVLAAIVWLYFAVQESGSHSATFGKRIAGICVTDLDGYPISFMRATGRHFSKIISGMICAIGYLMQPFTARKQALHDIIAGCVVIKSS